MTPNSVIILASIGLGLTIACAWRVATRDLILETELRIILAQLDAAMKAKGVSSDPGYQVARSLMELLIASAPYLSFPVLLTAKTSVRRNPPAVTSEQARATAESVISYLKNATPVLGEGLVKAYQSLPSEVHRARSKMNVCIVVHFLTTPSTLLVVGWLIFRGRSEELTSWVAELLDAADQLRANPLKHPTMT